MAQYNVLSGETIYDVAIKLYGGDLTLGLNDLILHNDIDIDADLYGLALTYTTGLTRKKPVFTTEEAEKETVYVTRKLQSIYDLTIQLYGDLSKIGILLKLFPNLDNEVTLNSTITFFSDGNPISEYFADNRMIIATDLISELPESISFDNIDITWDSIIVTFDQE